MIKCVAPPELQTRAAKSDTSLSPWWRLHYPGFISWSTSAVHAFNIARAARDCMHGTHAGGKCISVHTCKSTECAKDCGTCTVASPASHTGRAGNHLSSNRMGRTGTVCRHLRRDKSHVSRTVSRHWLLCCRRERTVDSPSKFTNMRIYVTLPRCPNRCIICLRANASHCVTVTILL